MTLIIFYCENAKYTLLLFSCIKKINNIKSMSTHGSVHKLFDSLFFFLVDL